MKINITNRAGFTVIELLIVVAILAVLITSSVVSYQTRQASLSFTNTFNTVVEHFRETRNLSLNSITANDNGTQVVPLAYGLHSDPTTKTITIYADFKPTQKNQNRVQYCFDRAGAICSSDKDAIIQKMTISNDYALENYYFDGKNYVKAKEMSLLFVAPFADAVIADETSKNIVQHTRMQFRLYDTQDVTRTRYLCINTIGGIIDERFTPCNKQ